MEYGEYEAAVATLRRLKRPNPFGRIDLERFVFAGYGSAVGVLLALGLTLVLIPEPDVPGRSPRGGMIDRPDAEGAAFLLPHMRAYYAPEPRESTLVLLAWLFGGVGAYAGASFGATALGTPKVLPVALVAAVPGLETVVGRALPAEAGVGLPMVSAALIVGLVLVPHPSAWLRWLKVVSVLLVGCYLIPGVAPPVVHVRWQTEVPDARREQLERTFCLSAPTRVQGTTWSYELLDTSRENLQAIVTSGDVDDTNDIDRIQFVVAPTAADGRRGWLLGRLPLVGRADLFFPALAMLLGVALALGRQPSSSGAANRPVRVIPSAR